MIYYKMCNMVRINKPSFEDWENKKLEDTEFLAAAETLEPGYQIARLQMLRGLTQA